MKKVLFTLFLTFFIIDFTHAQVGVNTVTPNAMLDIKASNQATPANTDGILIPKIDAFPVVNPTAAQKGMLVYLTTLSGGNPPGFYYWNNPGWVGMSSDSSAWKLTGNAGTNPLTDFIGTTDNQDLLFKRNGAKVGYLGTSNVAFGNNALNSFGGTNNIAFGTNSLSSNIGASNIGMGASSLSSNSGSSNIAIGATTLFSSTGSDNIALGNTSLRFNTSGNTNIAIGSSALFANTTGTSNIALGNAAGGNITQGTNNIMIGNNVNAIAATTSDQLNIGNTIFGSLGATKTIGINTIFPNGVFDVTSSTNGILIPRIALTATNVSAPVVNPQGGALTTSTLIYNTNTAGVSPNNVVPGFYYWDNTTTSWIGVGSNTANAWGLSGNSGTTAGTNYVGTTDDQDVVFKRFNVTSGRIGTNNTSYGNNALASNSGSQLTAIGLNALQSNTSGSFNTAVGRSALSGNTIGSSNTAVGRNSLLSNSTGDSNTATGSSSMVSNTTGSSNTANGASALIANTIGSENTAVGNAALRANIDGISNTSIGMESMLRNISGNNNSATGKFALANNISGSSNSAFGRASLIENTTGSFNTASGQSSLADNTTGSNNTATGYQALRSNTVGSENTALGYLSDVGSTNLTNATSIGARAEVTVSNALVLGSINGVNSATSGVNVGIGTTAPADRLHVVGNIRMVDGNQAAGKVFTSDANGTATWQTPAAAGTTLDGAYDFGGAGAGRTITADTGAVTIDGTDGLVSTGTIGTGATAPSGAGTRMVWNPKSAAFRVGIASGTQWDDFNIGAASIAFGANTIAFGTNSTAFGNGTTASASSSTAFGSGTTASGTFSIAFGNGTTASGNISTAFGNSSVASGSSSTAFGERNTAPSFGEIVLGIGATTYTPSVNGATQFRAANITDRLFVVGNALDANINNTVDPAERSDALVILKNGLTRLPSTTNAMITASDGKAVVTKEYLAANTSGTLDQAYDFGGAGAGRTITADTGAVTIDGTDGLVSTGTSGSGAVAPSGAGTRMVWNPNKAAFRAGNVTATQWDDANIGLRSMAFGNSTIASGDTAIAFGTNTTASGDGSTAFGFGPIASGITSTAFGASTTASGGFSTAFGAVTTASGNSSTVFGQRNTAPSFGETVFGIGATTYTPTLNGDTQFRAANVTDRLLVVGNALDANNNSTVDLAERRDALIILKNGLTRLPSTTNAMITASDGKAVVTKEYLAANTSGTLDQAYDFGGAGAGRTITADTGAVTIAGTDGLVATGTLGSGAVAPSGAGTRMVWNPLNAAFRAGDVTGTQWDGVNIGLRSTAFGGNCIANGNTATAFGFTTTASGGVSTAFGSNTIASGSTSTAFGVLTTASGVHSTAFGRDNSAPSFGETVLGIGATTYTPTLNGASQFRAANATDRLLVVGNAIDANNNSIVDLAERSDALVILKDGLTRLPSTTNAMITGSDGKAVVTKEYLAATTSGTLDEAYDFGGAGAGRTITADTGAVTIAGTDGLVSTGTTGSGALAPSGAGARMVWNPRKAAFRAGTVSGTDWDDANVGVASIALGQGTLASAPNSIAFGVGTAATGNLSTAMGSATNATASFSTAIGNQTTASGTGSTAMGKSTTASGSNSTVMGVQNFASSYGETVLGIGATTYTTSVSGDLLFRAANTTDRILAVGNAIDANSNNIVDGVERSDALVILKNGNTGIGTSTPQTNLEIVAANKFTATFDEGILNVVSNNPQNTNIGGSISLGGFGSSTTATSVFATVEGRKSNAGALSDSGYLAFKTNDVGALTERMRITSVGDVGIGTAAPGGQFQLSLDEGRKPGTNTWTIVSDQRLKTLNGNYTKGLNEILQLKPVRYNYKNNGLRTFEKEVLDTEFAGFLAQEVQPLFPEAVGTDDDGFLNFNIHPILIASVNALKELNAKNEQLEQKSIQLEQKSSQLEKENQSLKESVQAINDKMLLIIAEMEKLKK